MCSFKKNLCSFKKICAALQLAARRIGWLAHSWPTTYCTTCILRKYNRSCGEAGLRRNCWLFSIWKWCLVFTLGPPHFAFCGERFGREFLCWETTLLSLKLFTSFKTWIEEHKSKNPASLNILILLSSVPHYFVQTHSLTELSKLCGGKMAGQMIPETNRCLLQTTHLCLLIISFSVCPTFLLLKRQGYEIR